MTIDELIDALEKAEGPSRELDAEIAGAFGWAVLSSFTGGIYRAAPPGKIDCRPLPDFTSSLDAALTLVPEGWIWSVSSSGCVWVMPSDDVEGQIVVSGIADPIIALCIAALKARRNA